MPTKKERARAQAIYLNALREQADIEYKKSLDRNGRTTLPIDPQGRVLLEVRLDNEAWKNIVEHMHPRAPKETLGKIRMDRFKERFTTLLGHPIEDTTSISYDLQTNSNKPNSLQFQVRDQLTKNGFSLLDQTKITSAYQGLAKGQIISLQQETDSHAHLIGRMVKAAVLEAQEATAKALEKDPNNTDAQAAKQKAEKDAIKLLGINGEDKVKEGVEYALKTLNQTVLKLQGDALAKAYKKAYKNGVLDEKIFKRTLNKELDSARKVILPDIAKEVRIEIIKSTGITFDKTITQHLSRHLAERLTATPNDMVHIDKGNGTISFIGGSDKTSHHQEFGGNHTTDRMMYSHHLKENDNAATEVQALAHRQQVRVSSLAVKILRPLTEKLLDQDDKQIAKEKKKGNTFNFNAAVDRVDQRITELADKKGLVLSAQEKEQIIDEYKKMGGLIHGTPPLSRKDAFNKLVIADTADKIKALQGKYDLGDLETTPGRPKAFVYNLYTSINRAYHPFEMVDEGKNKQTQSAKHILAAAHQYNRTRGEAPLCLVQNIPVNGWGHAISIQDSNPLVVNEAALMAQLATLHTIYDVLPEPKAKELTDAQEQPTAKARADAVFTAYEQFLKDPNKNSSFYEYLKTKSPETLQNLQEIKKAIREATRATPVPVNSDLEKHRELFVKNAKETLALAFAQDAFSKLENGFTYQALSVFVEDASIGGCKSANERAQAVNGRVSVLDFVSLDKETRNNLLDNYLSEQEATKLKKFADELESAINSGDLPLVTKNMNALYESLNLEGFQALVSFIDQGGHAKLGSKGRVPNTNNCETVHTNVEKASKWQCHKGLTDNVLEEFCGIKKFSWKKEILNALKPVAAFVAGGGMSYGVALGIAAAVGVTACFPPAGLVFAAIAATAAVGLVAYTLCKVLPKWWASREAAVNERFDKIQKENKDLVPQSQPSLEKDVDTAINPIHHAETVTHESQPAPEKDVGAAIAPIHLEKPVTAGGAKITHRFKDELQHMQQHTEAQGNDKTTAQKEEEDFDLDRLFNPS